MRCPVCAGKLKTVMTRSDCEMVFRRKKCLDCGYVAYTAEEESEEAREAMRKLWQGNKE